MSKIIKCMSESRFNHYTVGIYLNHLDGSNLNIDERTTNPQWEKIQVDELDKKNIQDNINRCKGITKKCLRKKSQ